MSSETPKCEIHVVQTPGQTVYAPLPIQSGETEDEGASHSGWLTKTKEWLEIWPGVLSSVLEEIQH